MKTRLFLAAICAASVLLFSACEPEVDRPMTPSELMESYLPYEMGDKVTFRSDKGDETTMEAVFSERYYSDENMVYDKTLIMSSPDYAEMLSVMMTANEDGIQVMAMFERWSGVRESSDMYAGEYYFMKMNNGDDLTAFMNALDDRMVSTEGYNVYDDFETEENDMDDDGYCVLERGKGFVEFTAYGEV